MFSSLGYTEMLLIGIIALMLFGSKLPDVARNFGGTYRDLRRKVDDFQREFRDWDRPSPHRK
ncbi:MAG: twin-arginine translocase TatA/TatE family subunit [Pirellulaceae bacterium]